jgi:hypothetical protein
MRCVTRRIRLLSDSRRWWNRRREGRKGKKAEGADLLSILSVSPSFLLFPQILAAVLKKR